jgi:hypothetical protein
MQLRSSSLRRKLVSGLGVALALAAIAGRTRLFAVVDETVGRLEPAA